MPKIEHKAVGVSGLKVLAEEDGIIEAIVSVTGIRDNVNDIILPGAYEKSLSVRKPKGVWHHNWHESVSRTLAIKELMPGDPELPDALPNGQPWPAEAGALLVKTQFNLGTTRGKDAYADVKFFGDDQEWSIGYNVPVGGANVDSKSGIRSIRTLDLYEYSPVLFGAMPVARTSSVKDAQESYAEIKSLHGEEAGKFLMEIKSIMGEDAFTVMEEKGKGKDCDDKKKREPRDSDQGGLDAEDEWEEYEDDDTEEKSAGMSAELINKAIAALQACLPGAAPSEDAQEEKGLYYEVEQKTLSGLVADSGYDQSFITKVKAFDTAVESGDVGQMEETATPILDFVEAMMDMDASADEVKDISAYIAEQFKTLEDDPEEEDEEEEEDLEEEPEDEEKSGGLYVETKSISMDEINRYLTMG